MQGWVNPDRAGELSAIAAAQKKRALMRGMQELRHRKSRRSFAAAADGKVAQADNRQAGVPAAAPHPQTCYRAVERSQRGQRPACSRAPPKRRLAH